eukprot:CAMPEP_0114671012 /NCGR_PEP_ID=MMETSP0191-20121206/40426_1 /TAXON_ID=126664 /ORGANISM="Sorites sp." /LENGTH=141 /DNA_ID=CAMNT_0001929817 /DNA_START=678 /DNA_END=1100 /DNA_ORIENTATION=+
MDDFNAFDGLDTFDDNGTDNIDLEHQLQSIIKPVNDITYKPILPKMASNTPNNNKTNNNETKNNDASKVVTQIEGDNESEITDEDRFEEFESPNNDLNDINTTKDDLKTNDASINMNDTKTNNNNTNDNNESNMDNNDDFE